MSAYIAFSGAAARGQQSASSAAAGSPEIGQALFDGQIRFENGGPPCGACHAFAGLPYPNGGSMGPDLTDGDSKLGPDGLAAALETLYFPTMTPLFAAHPLTPDEQRHLAAFIRTGPRRTRGAPAAAWLAVAGLVGFLVLVIITMLAGRKRVRSVRGALLRRAGLPTGVRG